MAAARTWLAWCVMIALGIAAGCGKSEQRSANSNKPAAAQAADEEETLEASELITAEEVSEVLGETVGPPSIAHIGSGVSTCTYSTPSSRRISVFLRTLASRSEAGEFHSRARGQTQQTVGFLPEDIDGIGDKAYWLGGQVNQLHIAQGRLWIIITVTPDFTREDALTIARKAADIVMERLQ